MRARPSFAGFALLALLAAGCLAPAADVPGDATTSPPADVVFPALTFETDHGTFTAILFPEHAPETVAFVSRLVESGYYDGREFNRIIPGFVIQEVDRAGGATDQAERIPLEAGTPVRFSAGAMGIARDADPDSGGSEFFVMDFAHSHLWPNYTAFAQVVDGLDVVHEIARVEALSTRPSGAPQLPVPLALPLHDRIAVVPAKVVTASLGNVTLSAEEAAKYPLMVGNRTVVERTRYTPEWPANVGVGRESTLTWYVYTLPDDPPPDLSDAAARVEGPGGAIDLALVPDPADARILHARWTPAAPGEHGFQLVLGGSAVASAPVVVAPA